MRAIWSIVIVLVAASACGGSEPPMAAMDSSDRGAVPVYRSVSEQGDPTAIRSFVVDVPEPVLDDLRWRLRRTRYPDEIPGSAWDYGTNLDYLKELVTYWSEEFDWREQERQINELDHFKTEIDGLDIHCLHQRSPVEGATPLLISHGWPGSFLEFAKVIGPLTDPVAHGGNAEDAVQLVIPSIPGFGVSV